MSKRGFLATLFYVLSFIFVFGFSVYFILSILCILTVPNLLTLIVNGLLLLIEVIVSILGIYLFFLVSGALKAGKIPISTRNSIDFSQMPDVAVLIPVYNTEIQILEETLKGVENLEYPSEHLQFIVGDNSSDSQVTEWIKKWCQEKEWVFIHSRTQKGFKAGLLNLLLKNLKSSVEFVVLFDSDHIPRPNIIYNLIQGFTNEKTAYIQAKTFFRNTDSSVVGQANGILHSQFFEVIERSKNLRKAALFNGTTAAFRADILLKEGCFCLETFTEDIDTTVHLLSRGYQGFMIDIYGSEGLVPESLGAQVSQLWRWAHGATMILRRRTLTILRSPISPVLRFELLLNAFIFPAGLASTLLGIILGIMCLVGIPIFRPFGIVPLSIAISLVLFGQFFSGLIAMYWREEYSGTHLQRIFNLFWFYVLTFCAFPFLVSAIIEGFLGVNGPMSTRAKWHRNVHYFINSGFIFLLGIILVVIGIFSLFQAFMLNFNPYASWSLVLGTGFIFCIPLPLGLFLEKKTK